MTNVAGHPFLNPKNHASKGMHKSMEPRYKALKSKIVVEGADNPAGLAAYIARKPKKLAGMAKKGK